jgi:hypothetical protein
VGWEVRVYGVKRYIHVYCPACRVSSPLSTAEFHSIDRILRCLVCGSRLPHDASAADGAAILTAIDLDMKPNQADGGDQN